MLRYPNNASILGQAGYVLTYAGDQEKALERFDAALRLNPGGPTAFRYLAGGSIALTLMGRYADAVCYAEDARKRHPGFGLTYRMLAAAYAQLGEIDKAAQALARYLELYPASTISQLKNHVPYQNPEQAERLWDGLRRAGLPE